MAKRKGKSIMDLASKMPSVDLDAIEGEVDKIHRSSTVESMLQVKPDRTIEPPPGKSKKKVVERNVRVTVDTPASLHKLIKRVILDLDQDGDLRSFYLAAVREKCDSLGYSVEE